MTTTKKSGRPRGTLGPSAMSDYVDSPSGGKKVDRINKALKTYEKKARSRASKDVQAIIASAVAATMPFIKGATVAAPQVAAKTRALVNTIGLDKYITHVVNAFGPFSSAAAKAKSRAIIGKKPLTQKKGTPYREIKTPVQRSAPERATAARKAEVAATRKADAGRKPPKTLADLKGDVRGRLTGQGTGTKDTTKIPMTAEMRREASRFRASRRAAKKGIPSALTKAGAGAMAASTYAALKAMDEQGAKKSTGGKVKRNMGGSVRGVGAAQRGFGNAHYSNKLY